VGEPFDLDPGRPHLLFTGAIVRPAVQSDRYAAGELAVFGAEAKMERIRVPTLWPHHDLGLIHSQLPALRLSIQVPTA
jgi:hypothetical protein